MIVWSGGCDSTLLLEQYGKVGAAWGRAKSISFSHPQIGHSQVQKVARQKILAELRKRDYEICHLEVELTSEGDNVFAEPGDGLIQPIIWLAMAMPYLAKDETLYMGYVQSDDIWHRRENLFGAFDHLAKLMGKEGKLELPLEWYTKTTVYQQLQRKGLLDLCWTCESPGSGILNPVPCGHCTSCERREETMVLLEHLESKPSAGKAKKKALSEPDRTGEAK